MKQRPADYRGRLAGSQHGSPPAVAIQVRVLEGITNGTSLRASFDQVADRRHRRLATSWASVSVSFPHTGIGSTAEGAFRSLTDEPHGRKFAAARAIRWACF